MLAYPSETAMPTLLIALTSLLFSQAAPDGGVQVDPLAEGGWRLAVTVTGTQDPAVAQTRLVPTAVGLCADRFPRFGHYTFEANGLAPGQARASTSADAVTLVQTLTCADAVEVTTSSSSAAPILLDEARAAQLQPVILDLSNRYFDAVAQGRDEESYSLTLPEMTGGASFADWSATLARKRTVQGSATSRTLVKLSWYPDPPDSPRPGLYVAVDYVASWTLQDECGYVVWYSPGLEGPFLLVRQEQTFLPHDLDMETRAALRLQHCILL